MSECVFCDILRGESPASIVYQDDVCTAFMDIQPVNPGHVLVIPNRHAAFLADMDEDTGAHLFRVAQRLASALRKTQIECEGVNLFLADGEAAGQEIIHVHLHVFPRFKDDGFGFTFRSTYTNRPQRAELDTLAQQIRQEL